MNIAGDFNSYFCITISNFYHKMVRIDLGKIVGAITLPFSHEYTHIFRTFMKFFMVL